MMRTGNHHVNVENGVWKTRDKPEPTIIMCRSALIIPERSQKIIPERSQKSRWLFLCGVHCVHSRTQTWVLYDTGLIGGHPSR